VALLTGVFGLAMSRVPVVGNDEPLLLIYPEEMARGRIANRDFFTVYGQGGFRLLEAVYSIGGSSLSSERMVGVIYHIAIAVAVTRLFRSFGHGASLAAGLTSAVLFFGLPPVAFAWFGAIAMIMCGLAILSSGNHPSRYLVAGFLTGLACNWRPETLALALCGLPLVPFSKSWLYAAGVGVGAAPMAVHFAKNAAAVSNNLVGGRLLVNAQVDLSQVDPGVWVLTAAMTLSVMLTAVLAKRRSDLRRPALAVILLSLAVSPQVAQRFDLYHVLFGAVVVVPAGVAALAVLQPLPQRLHRMVLVTGVTGLAVLLGIGFSFSSKIPSVVVFNSGRTAWVSPEDGNRLSALIAATQARAPANSKVFVGPRDLSLPAGGDLILYHLLPEYSADSYFLEFPPGLVERPGSALVNDIQSADVLLLTQPSSRQSAQALFPRMARGDELANNVVANGFCARYTFDTGTLLTKGGC
jgi:hypothetical protein